MTTVTGAEVSFGYGAGVNVSPQVAAFTAPAAFSTTHALISDVVHGTTSTFRVLTRTRRHSTPAALAAEVTGAGPSFRHLNRIFILIDGYPYSRWATLPLGNLLSSTTRNIEVWNAYQFDTQTLVSDVASGLTGVTLTDPYGTPLDYLPMRSRVYSALINIIGDPNIDNMLTFDFGLDDVHDAPFTLITGIRLVPFTLEPDWAAEVIEGIEYLTDVFSAADTSEQRRQLRVLPRRHIEYTAKPMTGQESAYLLALLYGWIGHKYGVLAWPDAMRLTSSVSVGGTVLPVESTATRDFAAGQIVLLWVNPTTYEARIVESFDGTSITLTDELQQSWVAGVTRVIPVFIGSLSTTAGLTRHSSIAGEQRYAFLCEPRTT